MLNTKNITSERKTGKLLTITTSRVQTSCIFILLQPALCIVSKIHMVVRNIPTLGVFTPHFGPCFPNISFGRAFPTATRAMAFIGTIRAAKG